MHSNDVFDAIVVGSGMGGMTTATALSRMGQKVLLLEQAQSVGGLTHAFSREGFAVWGGVLAAAGVDPKAFKHLRG